MAQVIKYEELDGFNKNSDGTYEYTFYDYTYKIDLVENPGKDLQCRLISSEIKNLQDFIRTINFNTKIKKILCFYNCKQGFINPLNSNLIIEPKNPELKFVDILKFNENITVEYLDINNNPKHESLNEKYNLLQYLWNNGFNSVLQFNCIEFIDLSEGKFITEYYREKAKYNKYDRKIKDDKLPYQSVLTLKFDPNYH